MANSKISQLASGGSLDSNDLLVIARSGSNYSILGSKVLVKSQTFSDQTTVTVTHNLGYKPLVQVLGSGGNVIEVAIEHSNTSSFVMTSNSSISGTIIYY